MGSLPEAWIAPPELRELRELVRYRRKLSQLRTGLKAQIHAVLGKEGVIPLLTELWGPAEVAWLDALELADVYGIGSCRCSASLRTMTVRSPGSTARSTDGCETTSDIARSNASCLLYTSDAA